MPAATKTKKNVAAAVVAGDYLDLVRLFPLRPIHNEADYDQAIEILKGLTRRADVPGLTAGEGDYFDALSQLIGVYEDKHYPIAHDSTPIESLQYLMSEHGMNTTDLGKLLGSRPGQASLILHGKRELSKANIRTLAAHFKVSPALFL